MKNKRMYFYTIRISLILVVSISISLLTAPDHSHGFTMDRVIATIDDEAITLSDYQRFVKSIGAIDQASEVDEGVLRRLMEERVILHEAIRRGVEANDGEVNSMIEEFRKDNALSQEDLERELAKEGISLRNYRKLIRDKIVSLKLVGMDVDSTVEITDKEVENFYNANKRDYVSDPDRVEIQAIFLKLGENATVTEITDLKRKALKIAAQLKNGDSFEVLLNQYGDEFLKNKEGKLGEFERGALIPKLDEKAFSMREGEVSDPIWVKEGVYILKLIHKTGEKFRPMGEVKGEIQKLLYSQKRDRLLNEWIKTLWERSSITLK